MSKVYIALGGNIGDRRQNLLAAVEQLRLGGRLRLTALSSLYETRPVGFAEQPNFLNMVAEAETELEPLALLDALKTLEADLGREPNFRNGPRLIDLDILFYDDLIIETERLEVPHPRMRGRGFVLAPLAELAPGLVHSKLGLTVEELLSEIDLQAEGVQLYTAEPPLTLPKPRFVFVTGRLASEWLDDYLKELSIKYSFDYVIAALSIDVAAFINTRYVADNLKLPDEQRRVADLVILPGFARGELAQVEAAVGIKAVRGPNELTELEIWLCQLVAQLNPALVKSSYTEMQLRSMQARLTDSNIRIYTDRERIYAFNNQFFAVGGPDERELRSLFRQLKIDNASHSFYLGREFYKAALAIKLGLPYRQDCDLPFPNSES